jgi:hypothetical protein
VEALFVKIYGASEKNYRLGRCFFSSGAASIWSRLHRPTKYFPLRGLSVGHPSVGRDTAVDIATCLQCDDTKICCIDSGFSAKIKKEDVDTIIKLFSIASRRGRMAIFNIETMHHVTETNTASKHLGKSKDVLLLGSSALLDFQLVVECTLLYYQKSQLHITLVQMPTK